MMSGGKYGVNIFVLISGWFLIDSRFSGQKVFKLWFKTTVYAILLAFLFIAHGWSMGIRNTIRMFMFSDWWFARTYCVMYMLINPINRFIRSRSKESLLSVLLVLLVLLSVLPTFLAPRIASSDLAWFIFLYISIAYIKIYQPKIFSSKHNIAIAVGIYLLTYLASLVFYVIGLKIAFSQRIAIHFFDFDSIFLYISSLFLVAGAKNFSFHSKAINKIASATFGVYLIHDHFQMRPYLWIELFKNSSMIDSPCYIVHAISCCLAVYAVCTLVDFVYMALVEKPVMKLVNAHWDSLTARPSRVLASSVAKAKEMLS